MEDEEEEEVEKDEEEELENFLVGMFMVIGSQKSLNLVDSSLDYLSLNYPSFLPTAPKVGKTKKPMTAKASQRYLAVQTRKNRDMEKAKTVKCLQKV